MTEPPPPPPPPPDDAEHGRGAWPKSGAGGTLAADRMSPGPYYAFVKPELSIPLVGSGGWASTDGDERAVHGAVRAIQRRLRQVQDPELGVTGKFDETTRQAVIEFQTNLHDDMITPWGGVDPRTAKALFLPLLQSRCEAADFQYWEIACGVVQNESAWDPGAVGYHKPVDIGLAQINGDSHPDMSERKRLQPVVAFDFVINYLRNAMRIQNGDVDLAIASYNLGQTGAKRWDEAGRPDPYQPTPTSVPRSVPAYIQRIKTACVESG